MCIRDRFSVWPIARACDLPAASLFRDSIARFRILDHLPFAVATIILLAGLGALAVETAHSRSIAMWFVGGAAAAIVLFGIAGVAVARAAQAIGGTGGTSLRLALANLHRPGAPTGSVVLSLGLGLAVLITVALIETNLGNQITKSLPERAPGYFFIDIQNDQVEAFEKTVTAVEGFREIRRTPMLRGRVARLNGEPAKVENVAEDGRWILRGDRGVTWARDLPDGETVVAGDWWPRNYSGPPLVSVAARNAAALGLGLLRLQALSAVLEPNLHRARRHAERLRDRLALVEVRQRLLLERLDEHGELLPGDLAALRLRLLGRRPVSYTHLTLPTKA